MAEQSGSLLGKGWRKLGKTPGKTVMQLLNAAMAEWSNAPVWKAGLLTEARVQISFAASLLFLFEKKKKCAASQKEKRGVFL